MSMKFTDAEVELIAQALCTEAARCRDDAKCFAAFFDDDSKARAVKAKADEEAVWALHAKIFAFKFGVQIHA